MGKKKNKVKKVKLVLDSYHEIDSIFATMLYNAQRSIFKQADKDKTDFLQRLLNQVSDRLIFNMSTDVQSLALIEHWGLKHPGLDGRLEKMVTSRVLEDAPDGIHIKEVNRRVGQYTSGIMLEADRRATETMRKAMSDAETDTRLTILTVQGYK